jgi:hypothetical protein
MEHKKMEQKLSLRFMMSIPHNHSDLLGIIFNSSEILEMLRKVRLTLPYSNDIYELVIELKDMDGVAHTGGPKGKKKVTLSSNYFIEFENNQLKKEYLGVLCHELVHAIQYDGLGTADGGVIEGIADYGMLCGKLIIVRLKVMGPADHWKRLKGGKWNDGYSSTAYFFEWIENFITKDFVTILNSCLEESEWSPNLITQITGTDVEELWETYQASLGL